MHRKPLPFQTVQVDEHLSKFHFLSSGTKVYFLGNDTRKFQQNEVLKGKEK